MDADPLEGTADADADGEEDEGSEVPAHTSSGHHPHKFTSYCSIAPLDKQFLSRIVVEVR